jgi:hypothetical protein
MAIKLLDLSARAEHVSAIDDNKEKTKFIVGPLTARQLFAIYGRFEDGSESSTGMALMAMEMVKYGLRDVKGELGKGFSLKKGNKLGFKCDVVNQSYIDTLPVSIITEVAQWVGEMSRVGEVPKDNS